MNDEQVIAASFLLYQRIKVAVAISLLKSIPKGANIQEFAMSFQYRFREKANRCNLHLEKLIFRNRFVLLLPELKIYSIEQRFFEPMDICDEDSEQITYSFSTDEIPSCTIHQETIRPKTLVLPVLQKIETISGFMDAVQKTKLLCDENRNVALAEVMEILSKLEISNTNDDSSSLPKYIGHDLLLSIGLFQYLIKSVNAERIIRHGSLEIISLFEEYFEKVYEDEINVEALKTIQSANNIIFKICSTTFPNLSECNRAVAFFLRKSLTALLIGKSQKLNRSICDYWYSMFGVWKEVESTCAAMIDTLIRILKDVEYNMYLQVVQVRFAVTKYSLILLKRLLITYYEKHAVKRNKLVHSEVEQWEEILSANIAETISQQSNSVRLAWHCLKLLISLKLCLKEE